ncbi:MAG: hypothetical protein MK193_05205 [Lentisphaeria bacterium]|nr:hypothetical protein [Lentisphaeria bacterium]
MSSLISPDSLLRSIFGAGVLCGTVITILGIILFICLTIIQVLGYKTEGEITRIETKLNSEGQEVTTTFYTYIGKEGSKHKTSTNLKAASQKNVGDKLPVITLYNNENFTIIDDRSKLFLPSFVIFMGCWSLIMGITAGKIRQRLMAKKRAKYINNIST